MVTTIVNLALPIGDPNRVINIQGYQAENYSETPSQPNFDPIEIGGRSSPIAYYNGGSARTVSFSMMFHRDMVAPQTSAVSYGGMPAGIEADDSQYAGLYLGENSQGLDNRQLRDKFVRDYIKWHNEFLGGAMINGERYNMLALQKNQKLIYLGNQVAIATYDDEGRLLNTEIISSVNGERIKRKVTKRYSQAWEESNLNAEADATARFHLFMNKIRALNYPVYHSNGIIPPKIYLKIGGDSNSGLGGIRLKGYCTTNINYDGIVKDNSLISTTVDFTFTEVVDIAWSATEIINGMQRYTQWMDPLVR